MKENNKINICEEAVVPLFINNSKFITFMATPINLEELAIGHLFIRGILDNFSLILGIGICNASNKINIILNKNKSDLDSSSSTEKILLSSCGSGSIFDDSLLPNKKINFEQKFSITDIKNSFINMLSQAIIYKKTGGMHCASLTVGKETFVCEDIGRHNAIDKVIGAALLQNKTLNLPIQKSFFHNSYLITTGRISVDMVLKAISAQIPVIASRSIPSSLAIELAERFNITIIGRLNSEVPIIYTHNYKITTN